VQCAPCPSAETCAGGVCSCPTTQNPYYCPALGSCVAHCAGDAASGGCYPPFPGTPQPFECDSNMTCVDTCSTTCPLTGPLDFRVECYPSGKCVTDCQSSCSDTGQCEGFPDPFCVGQCTQLTCDPQYICY
jgi:hypothetical protein